MAAICLGIRRWRALALLGFLIPALVIWMLWYAVNSDRDDVHPILTQLIPAGHCTCQSATVFECSSCLHSTFVDLNDTAGAGGDNGWTYEYERDAQNLGLSEEQCDVAFPGLYEDVDLGVKHWTQSGPITAETLGEIQLENGMTRAMLYDGHLYIIASKSKGEDHRRKTLAILSSMHRAYSASSTKPPNIEFVFSIEDKATDVIQGHDKPLWVVARKATEKSLWLVPDFGLWAWDNVIKGVSHEIGPYDEVVEKAKGLEKTMDFAEKESKLVWRGKLSFAPKLRRALLDQSRGHEWSDVKEVNWDVRQNFLALEDHCKYQFIAHAEGRSYSASLKYRQACRSVIVAHKLQYIQHHHYLLLSQGPLQNYVEVERDFSNLPQKMANLLDHPDKAAKIADNSVRTFRERYLTPAADACYWRALWKGYASVSGPATLWVQSAMLETLGEMTKRGTRFESFVLLSSDEMMDYRARSG